MKTQDIKQKILEHGYWRVIIRPVEESYKRDRFKINELKNVLEKSQIRMRGWYYPHLHEPAITDRNKISESTEFHHGLIEYWEFFTSGQFANIFAIEEDHVLDQDNIRNINESYRLPVESRVSKFLDVMSTLYRLTEIYAFAANLAQLKEYGDVQQFTIEIELHGVKNRMLYNSDPSRHMWSAYICKIEQDKIGFENTYQKDDLIAQFPKHALDIALELFELFTWSNPSKQKTLDDEQRKFLIGRF